MVLEFVVSVFNTIFDIFRAIPFSSATWIVIGVLTFFIWLFTKAHKDPNSPVRWEHLITDSYNDRTSPYKLGYLIGVIVSTWLVIFLANKEKGELSFDIFGTYLAFLLGGAGWNSYMKNRNINGSLHHEHQHQTNSILTEELKETEVKPPRL